MLVFVPLFSCARCLMALTIFLYDENKKTLTFCHFAIDFLFFTRYILYRF